MIPCIGLASGLGAGNQGCAYGPPVLRERLLLELDWKEIIYPDMESDRVVEAIAFSNQQLADLACTWVEKNTPFICFGGDHSSGIGMWSGVSAALRKQGNLGLIWIDAHMDAHTPQTSESGNIHGMPLAVLLGHGENLFTSISDFSPKILPENLVLIGVRSFEQGEADLLKSLNVRIYFMEEIIRKGLDVVLQEAVEIVSANTVGYGISFDLDSVDPLHAPAVGTPVPGGLDPEALFEAFSVLEYNPPIALEIVEYNPFLDQEFKSLAILRQLVQKMMKFLRSSAFFLVEKQ
jgi:arginase